MIKKLAALLLAVIIAITALPIAAAAEAAESKTYGNVMPQDGKLRRPISPEQPMWIVHIDTWNNANPDEIIDLIPEDVLPYVVFNISLSVNWDSDTNTWGTVQYGYETAKSWLRTCAERQVWTFIQPASGGQCHFPDYPYSSLDGTLFEEFFKEYPNFLGFNYCEQFWGFDQEDFPTTAEERYLHFANLLELTHRYGGYLVDSWCGNEWGQNINPLAMLKRVPEFEEAARTYSENFILCEKYTQHGYIQDEESHILGAFLSGYSGQYGIRYDETGWSGKMPYTMATGLATQLERLVKNGLTVIDGPELIPEDCFFESDAVLDEDGYLQRNWESYVQFKNVAVDMFRKVIDGSIRIPTREEVIKNTKVVMIQDVNTGSDDNKYCSIPTLFKGLYQMDGDGELRNNHNFYKKTGRYPTVPTVYNLADDLAKSFEIQIKHTEVRNRWSNIDAKVAEFNSLFPEESTGDIYAGRNKNTWVVYNPLKTGKSASGNVSLQYNTAESLDLTLSKYTTGIINEYADSMNIYLNNFDNDSVLMLSKDIITINGCSEEPTLTFNDRVVEGLACEVKTEYKDGTFTATVAHNGPVDIEIKVKGNAANRATDYNVATFKEPERPGIYYGDRQYEAELYGTKNVERVVKNGCRSGVENYVGQGYMIFGTDKKAAVSDIINTLDAGQYKLSVRYALANEDVGKLALYVNGKKIKNLDLKKTGSVNDWALCEQVVSLKQGENKVELKATGELEDKLYLDCIILGGERLGDAKVSLSPVIFVIIGAVIAAAVIVLIIVSKKKNKAK